MDDKYYTGDTFVFPFGFQNENKEPIDFEVGDILRFGMKESIYRKQYSLYKEIKITENTSEIQITFLPEETQQLFPNKKYIIELELTRGEFVDTIYQDEILVKGDVVNNVSKVDSNT